MGKKLSEMTLEELWQLFPIVLTEHQECWRKWYLEEENLLKNACKCKNVSIQEIVNAVNNGADTVEKVGEATGAGTACGRCKGIISNIIENKR